MRHQYITCRSQPYVLLYTHMTTDHWPEHVLTGRTSNLRICPRGRMTWRNNTQPRRWRDGKLDGWSSVCLCVCMCVCVWGGVNWGKEACNTIFHSLTLLPHMCVHCSIDTTWHLFNMPCDVGWCRSFPPQHIPRTSLALAKITACHIGVIQTALLYRPRACTIYMIGWG